MKTNPTNSLSHLGILCVDDEEHTLASLRRVFHHEAFQVLTATSGDQGLAILKNQDNIGLILSDQRMPGMSGSAFLEAARELVPDVPRMILTGYAETQSAIDAINRGGAYRYLTKPWNDQELLLAVRDGLYRYQLTGENRRLTATVQHQNVTLAEWNLTLTEQVQEQTGQIRTQLAEILDLKQQLEHENRYLRTEVRMCHEQGELIGASEALKKVLLQAERVTQTNTTVLIQGETGTGKELVAQFIHQQSNRGRQVMIKVNCAAIPENLVESELFGREKGAFTGAVTTQIGRFEMADGSTIFLDEIGEIPLGVQVKLLRVLQEKKYERLGNPITYQTDVRVIAATNRDLAEEVRQGRFREDLFYRLNVFPIKVPPLRERVEDIPQLVWSFVHELGARMGKNISKINAHDMEALQNYGWPGNIRELRNVIERALIFGDSDCLRISLPDTQQKKGCPDRSLRSVERHHIVGVLTSTNWRVHGKYGAARILDINPNTLFFRMKKLDIPLLHEQRDMGSSEEFGRATIGINLLEVANGNR